MFKKLFKQRGQTAVLYALLIPVLILFAGVGIDLGWYYLNVSRLQNAADAAVLAGAWKILEDDQDYIVTALAEPPTDLQEYNTLYVWDSKKGSNGAYEEKTADTAAAKAEAILYSNKNLVELGKDHADLSDRTDVLNEWSTVENLGAVNIQTTLYGKVMDIMYEEKNKVSRGGTKYYEVKLSEKISHLFFGGFAPMNATVVAYAMMRPHDKSFIDTIKPLEETKTIHNWEYQNYYHDFEGNWNHFQDRGIHYKTGDDFRTEVINIQQSDGSGASTPANGNNYYKEDQLDNINIDFRIDSKFDKVMTTNWDLRTALPAGFTRTAQYNDGWKAGYKDDLRVHTSMNFNYGWKDRDTSDLKADVLWTRIEAEPIWSKMPFKTQYGLNSVRQIIMNVTKSNTNTATYTDPDTGEKTEYYTQRPFFVFYTGPETNDDPNTVRESQPVILNLYEDWNAILYMPNSPVIINGNGHKLTGFVIAKEFRRLKTEQDFIAEGFIVTTDANSNTIYVKRENLLTEEEFNKFVEDNNYMKTITESGNIKVAKKVEGPQHTIISINKEVGKQYDSFGAYINANYKREFLEQTGLSESQVTSINFPKDGNIERCDETYTVATADLSDTPLTSSYVPVLVGDQTKYIDKIKLPYIKVRRNSSRPYVSVYDFHKTKVSGDSGVNTIDDSITSTGSNESAADIWKPSTDQYKNDKYINKALLEGTYDEKYVDTEITVVEEDGKRYFMLGKPVTIGEYRKVTQTINGEEKVFYVKEDAETEEDETDIEPSYYIKVVPNGAKEENAVIISNKGDLQSVLLDSSYTRPTNEDEQPTDPGQIIDGKYRRKSTANRDKDYKIPELEVVYDAKKAFNLSKDSGYSYFNIEDLRRVNYLYLNVDELNDIPQGKSHVEDMFFTTQRAAWID